VRERLRRTVTNSDSHSDSNIYSDPKGSKKPRYDPPARRNVTPFSRSPAAVRSAPDISQAVSFWKKVLQSYEELS